MPHWFRVSMWSILLVMTVGLSMGLHQVETRKSRLRDDLATLQEVRYGLFNIDEWKGVIGDILADKLEAFDLEEGQRDDMALQIQGLLMTLINDLETSYNEDRSSSIRGIFEREASRQLKVFEQMRKDAPEMAMKIVAFLDNPEQRKQLHQFMMNTVADHAEGTVGTTDYAAMDNVLQRHGFADGDRPSQAAACTSSLKRALALETRSQRPLFLAGVLFFVLTVASLLWLTSSHVDIKLAALNVAAWLWMGIGMPMLMIDARIDRLEFQLLDVPVAFSDQVLFYQSKSIVQVVRLLLFDGQGFGAIIAGAGVLAFSILVPALKLGSTLAWHPKAAWTQTKVGQWLLFQSAKWAMADVMVVAIFLSFLGFQGVLSDQVSRLQNLGGDADLVTTANSNLLPGFLAFFAFALLGLILSNRLHRLHNLEAKPRT